jgi:hypothetical protein
MLFIVVMYRHTKKRCHRDMCNKTSESLDPGSLHHRFKIIHVLRLILIHFYSIPSSVVSTSIASVTNKLESANHLSNGKET